MDGLFPWWAAEGSVVGLWRPASESHLTMWAMSQLVSEDRGLMISTPSSVTMAISYWNGTTQKEEGRDVKGRTWSLCNGACCCVDSLCCRSERLCSTTLWGSARSGLGPPAWKALVCFPPPPSSEAAKHTNFFDFFKSFTKSVVWLDSLNGCL